MKRAPYSTILLFLCVHGLTGAIAETLKVNEIFTPQKSKVWLLEDHSTPIVCVSIVVNKGGFNYDPAGKEGRSAIGAILTSHYMNKFRREMQEEKILGTSLNTQQGHQKISFITSPQNLEKSIRLVLKILVNFESEIKLLRQAKHSFDGEYLEPDLSSPFTFLIKRWMALSFPRHAYGSFVGTKDGVTALNLSDFKDYWKGKLTKDNIRIAVTGDISEEDIKATIDKALSDLPTNSNEKEINIGHISPAEAPLFQVFRIESPQSHFFMAQKGPRKKDKDYHAFIVLMDILGGNPHTSILSQEIREKLGLVYSIQAQPEGDIGLWQILFSTDNKNAGQVYKEVIKTLNTILSSRISKEKVEASKKALLGAYATTFVNFSGTCLLLAEGLSDDEPPTFLSDFIQKLEAVTVEDVERVAKKYIKPGALRVVVLGNPIMVAS